MTSKRTSGARTLKEKLSKQITVAQAFKGALCFLLLMASGAVATRYAGTVSAAIQRAGRRIAGAPEAPHKTSKQKQKEREREEQRERRAWAAAARASAKLPQQKPDEYVQGEPIGGSMGEVRTTAQIMDAQRHAPTRPIRPIKPEREMPKRDTRPQNPNAPAVSRIGGSDDESTVPLGKLTTPKIHTTSLSFNGATLSDTGAFPPDTMGAPGPSQYLAFENGRIRSFTKAGVADGVLNADPDVFFASVMTPVGGSVVLNFTSDPNVRYDRFTARWFMTIIDVPCTNATCTTTAANRLLIAVSDAASNGVISGSTVWTFFQFVGDPGTNFLDYPSLGIDVNALYIGGNMFSSAGSFVGTNGYVVQKASILGAGPIVATMFANLATGGGAGPESPRGVDNFDASATEGYFVGPDNASFSTISFRRVTSPGSASPTISGNIQVTVPTTTSPNTVEHAGNTGGANGNLDSIDDRFFAAMIRNGRLWSAHHFRVSAAGVANTAANSRNAVRWYEFQNLTTTPTVVQSGTVYDNASTRAAARQYWVPSVAVNGQGHAVLGFTMAGTPVGATPAYVGRLAGDTLGTMTGPPTVAAVTFGTTTANYNPPSDPGGTSGRRWGDYSFTVVDPLDDMTIWTIQEYNQASNSYAVRIAKLLAPPPATPSTASPSSLADGQASVNVTITGTSSSGSGFYDPGSNLPAPARPFNHISASVTGGVTVNSVTYTDPTHITLNLSTVGAAAGLQNITITNPDGQAVTANNFLTITSSCSAPPTPTIAAGGPTTFCAGGSVLLTSSSATGNQWYLNGSPISGATNQSYSATASGSYTVVVTVSGCPSAPSAATVVTVNPIPATPTISAGGATTFCAGGNVTLTSSSATGNQWYLNGNPIGGATSQSYSATASGNYTVIVTTNGCASAPSAATAVTVNPIPATPTISAGGATTFCAGGSVMLTSSSASGNQWYLNGNPIGGATNQTYSATASGSYTVIVTTNGCSSAASAPTSVTVNPTPPTPTISAGGPATFCAGGSVLLTSSSATGNQWYLNGNPISGSTSQTYSATATGNYTVIVTANGCPSAPSVATTVTVNPIPPTPTISAGGATTFCAGGSVTLTSSSASGNQWYLNGNPISGAASQTYNATAAGDYTVIVTTNGCASAPSAATIVTVNPVPATPTISAGGPTTFCAGGSVTLTSSSVTGNQWYLNGNPIGGATSQTYNATASGNYTVVVTASGCASASSAATVVTVNPIPATPTIAAGGATTFCAGGSVTLTSSSATGNQWYLNGNPLSGATSQTYNATAAGSYTVIVTTNGCASAPSAATTVTVNPTPPTPTISAGGSTTFCAGGSVTLTSSSVTGNQWYLNGNPISGATNQTYNATAAGNYTVIVTANGCSSAPSAATAVTVNPLPATPTISAGGPTAFCVGGSVLLTSSSATGNQWYLNGNPIGGATGQTYSASSAGNYTVVVTANGCPSAPSAVTSVTVNPLPATPTISAGGPTTFCAGGSVTLTSSSASGNQWYLNGNPIGGATSQTYSATASGNYTVIVTTGGCSSVASAPTAVTVNPAPPMPTISAGGPTSFCTGGSVLLTSSSATGNQWSLNGNPISGATSQTYNATASGNYTVIVTANGCPSTPSVVTTVTVNPLPATPTISAGGPTTFCAGGSVTLTSSSATGNQWSLNGNPISGATSQTYNATASGNYTVIVTANGCPSTPSVVTTVTVNPLPATPTISAGGPTTFCEGGSVTLTSSSATGNQWYRNGNPISGATGQAYLATVTGDYTVVVTASGCPSAPSTATTVTVNPTPLTPTINAGGPTTFCVGGSVTLTSSSAAGNQWYLNGNPIGGATGQTFNATAAGNYTVVVTANGCPSAPSAATVVTVNPLPTTPTISAGGATTFCAGGSVLLTSSSATGNQWYLNGNPIGGATSQTYSATASGNYTVIVTANGCPSAASAVTTITVNPLPTITLGVFPSVLQGTLSASLPYSATTGSPNQYSIDYDATANVAGFVDVTNAVLPSSPLALVVPGGALPATYNALLTVRNSATGCVSGSAPFTVTVTPCPTITLAALPAATVGSAYSQTLTASPSGTYTFALAGGSSLPPGFSGLAMNGLLAGTPTQTGTFNFNVIVTGPGSCAATVPVTLVVNCPAITLSPLSLPSANLGATYSQTLTAAPTGTSYSFAVTSGALPPGLTLSSTGALTGAPSSAGSFNFTVTATGFGTCTGAQAYTLVVSSVCPTISFTTTSLPGGQVGTAYNQTLAATGGTGPYSFAVTSGALPNGVTLSTSGALTGVPTLSGTFNFTATATGVGGCTGTQNFSIVIGCTAISLTPGTLPGAQAGMAYSQTVTASPAGSYTYSVSTGNLPPGVTLNAATGTLSGTATTAGSYSFTVQATGAGNCSGTQAYTIVVTCPVIIVAPAGGTLTAGTVGTVYSQTFSATPAASYAFAVVGGALPGGLSLSPAGLLSGTPSASGTFTFTVQATGFGTCLGTQTYSLTINVACTTITLPPLPSLGIVGLNYSGSLAGTTPSGTYTFNLQSGTLPPGLAINNADAALAGKPTAVGRFNFTLKATDGNGCMGTRSYSILINSAAAQARFGDYDGDGKADTALWQSSTGAWNILTSSGATIAPQAWGGNGDIPLMGDYDGDGKSDLAVFRPSNGTWYVWRSGGGFIVQAWGGANDIPVPNDYDGDGKTDLAIWRPTEGNWYIWNSSDGNFTILAWGLGSAPYLDVPLPGDYDGDGLADLAVFRRSTGAWYVQLSSTGGVSSIVWGASTDVPIPSDYDGDGKLDVAVWRGTSGQWLIVQSSNNQPRVEVWGSSQAPFNDYVVPGDYDGDGKTDLSIWRPSATTWYQLLSGAGLRTIVQGAVGYRPVGAR